MNKYNRKRTIIKDLLTNYDNYIDEIETIKFQKVNVYFMSWYCCSIAFAHWHQVNYIFLSSPAADGKLTLNNQLFFFDYIGNNSVRH